MASTEAQGGGSQQKQKAAILQNISPEMQRFIALVAVVLVVLLIAVLLLTAPSKRHTGTGSNNTAPANSTIPQPYLNNTAPNTTRVTAPGNSTNITASLPSYYPQFLAYDPSTGLVDVENLGPNTGYGYATNFTFLKGTQAIYTAGSAASVSPSSATGQQFSIYDPINRHMYIVSGTYTYVLNGTAILAALPIGTGQSFSVSNPAVLDSNGSLYLADAAAGSVYMINGTSYTAISAGQYPSSVAYDKGDNYVYADEYGTDGPSFIPVPSTSAAVISGTSVIANVTVGADPASIIANPSTGTVYSLGLGSGSVTAISGLSAVSTIKLVQADINYPGWLLYNPGNSDVYAIYTGSSGEVAAISGESVMDTIALKPPVISVYNSSGELFIDSGGSNDLEATTYITKINGTANLGSTAIGGSASYMAYDPATGYLYAVVENQSSRFVPRLIAIKNGSVTRLPLQGITNIVYDPSDGYLYVGSSPQNISVISGTKIIAEVSA